MDRVDILLVKKGLLPSRQKAIEAIKSGCVKANGQLVKKPSEKYDDNVDFSVGGDVTKYVSRAGKKLEKAINEFGLDFTDKTILDMGSSTGGFTDCALQFGAKKVYAVDVGKDQLAESLKNNSKVVSMEQTDIRSLDKQIFDDCDFVVGDLSFISIIKVLECITEKITGQNLVLLIKPQFECGVEMSRKYKGVIRDYNLSKKICNYTIAQIKKLGYNLIDVADSPIKGGDGNSEFIILVKK